MEGCYNNKEKMKKMNMGIFRMGNNGCQTSKGEILATLKTMHGSLLLMQQVKNVLFHIKY